VRSALLLNTARKPAQYAIIDGARKYTDIKPPILAIMAVPMQCAPNCDSVGSKAAEASQVEQANAFAAGNPAAHIVRLAYAKHYVFRSNEADVLREMNSFMDGLPKR
jgi:hypothetical protein